MDRDGILGIARALQQLRQDLEELARAGEGIPAVDKNVLRMKGTLRTLEIQFADLAALETESG